MKRFSVLAVATSLAFSITVLAEEEMDVDLSDSLDFEAFHTDKKEAVKLWEKKEVEKSYQENSEAQTTGSGSAETEHPATTEQPTATTVDKKGKRYEIRELYSISGSERTGYTPSTVVQALYLQMQGLCPNGWRKLDERSQPDGPDAFYMYYSLECL